MQLKIDKLVSLMKINTKNKLPKKKKMKKKNKILGVTLGLIMIKMNYIKDS